jgi:hypothetical protein
VHHRSSQLFNRVKAEYHAARAAASALESEDWGFILAMLYQTLRNGSQCFASSGYAATISACRD